MCNGKTRLSCIKARLTPLKPCGVGWAYGSVYSTAGQMHREQMVLQQEQTHSAAHCRFSFRICVNVNVGYVIGCRQVGVDCWRVRKYADEIRRRRVSQTKTNRHWRQYRDLFMSFTCFSDLCHTYCLTFSLIWKVPQHFVTWNPVSFSTCNYSVFHQIWNGKNLAPFLHFKAKHFYIFSTSH